MSKYEIMITTISFEFNKGFWFFVCKIKLSNGSESFFSECVTEDKAKIKAKDFGMALPVPRQGAVISRDFSQSVEV